ncbi:MAG: hypothetical protein NT062_14400 [Proteobacteria bacterium]|nr:hypothetical protein [Pseudomonadota bacterium]
MATKKATAAKKKSAKTSVKKAATTPKKAPKEKQVAKTARHPRGRVIERHGSKEALAKTLSESLAREDQDATSIATSLKTASNQQLLRLAKVVDAVKQKYGSRAKLITAIGTAEKKSTDKDFLAALDKLPLPQLFAMASSVERRARA